MTWEQALGLILLAVTAVLGIYLLIEDAGGWTLFWGRPKRKRKK